jgi:hypothetical protein
VTRDGIHLVLGGVRTNRKLGSSSSRRMLHSFVPLDICFRQALPPQGYHRRWTDLGGKLDLIRLVGLRSHVPPGGNPAKGFGDGSSRPVHFVENANVDQKVTAETKSRQKDKQGNKSCRDYEGFLCTKFAAIRRLDRVRIGGHFGLLLDLSLPSAAWFSVVLTSEHKAPFVP